MNAVLKLGNAILGEWRGRPRGRPSMPAWERQAKQRRNELSRLIKYRRDNGLDMGTDEAWAGVLGNTIAALRQPVDLESVADLAARLGLDALDPDKVEAFTADIEQARRVWGTYRLRTAAQVASMLGVTSVERSDCDLRTIGSVDEPEKERRRRLARERQAKRRAKGAGPRPATQAQMAAAAGLSLSTWKRRQRSGEPNSVTLPTDLERARAHVTRARVNSVTENGSSQKLRGVPGGAGSCPRSVLPVDAGTGGEA